MKAFEVMGTIDEQGKLSVDDSIDVTSPCRVRVIVLLPETADDTDDESSESVKASLRRSLQEAKAGHRLPLSKMWEGIDAD